MIMEAVGIEKFGENNIKSLIGLLYKIQTSELHQEADPQKSYILIAWQMILYLYRDRF